MSSKWVFVPLLSLFARNRQNSTPGMPKCCTNLDLMMAKEGIYVNFKRPHLKPWKMTISNNIHSFSIS